MSIAPARDPCAVVAAPLVEMLDDFVARWEQERPPNRGGQFDRGGRRRSGTPFVGAIAWLSSETGLARHDIENVRRRRTVPLRVADPLVAALGRPDAFHDGDPPTLEIVPNPAAAGRGRGCLECGGSLTGAA